MLIDVTSRLANLYLTCCVSECSALCIEVSSSFEFPLRRFLSFRVSLSFTPSFLYVSFTPRWDDNLAFQISFFCVSVSLMAPSHGLGIQGRVSELLERFSLAIIPHYHRSWEPVTFSEPGFTVRASREHLTSVVRFWRGAEEFDRT